MKYNPKVSFGGSESATSVFVEVSDVYFSVATGVTPLSISASQWMLDYKNWCAVPDYPSVFCYCPQGDGDIKPLPPNTKLDGVALFMEDGDKDVSTIAEDATAAQIKDAEFSPKFKAYAVQSGGFADAKAAWESVSKHG